MNQRNVTTDFNRMLEEERRTKNAFVEAVRALGIDGLIVGSEVKIHPSTELHKKCGATTLSGFWVPTYNVWEISLKKPDGEKERVLSEEVAMAVGLDDQVHQLYKEELHDFLVKLVKQTK